MFLICWSTTRPVGRGYPQMRIPIGPGNTCLEGAVRAARQLYKIAIVYSSAFITGFNYIIVGLVQWFSTFFGPFKLSPTQFEIFLSTLKHTLLPLDKPLRPKKTAYRFTLSNRTRWNCPCVLTLYYPRGRQT